MDELHDLVPDLEGFDDQALHQLIERAAAVNDMAHHPGWPIFCDYLIATTGSAQARLIEGYCRSYEEYRELVGQIRAIKSVLEAPQRLLAQVEALHEQAEQASQNGDLEVDS